MKNLINLLRKSIMNSNVPPTNLSKAGRLFLQRAEGISLKPYLDSAGYLTVGYGHKILKKDPIIQKVLGVSTLHKYAQITEEEADALLVEDLKRFEKAVVKLVTAKITQSQFDALVCFAFNLGNRALEISTLLKRVNEGNIQAAVEELYRWVFVTSGGQKKKVPGLMGRRAAEQAVFLYDTDVKFKMPSDLPERIVSRVNVLKKTYEHFRKQEG